MVQDDYGVGVEPADFLGDPETARNTINAWVSNQTRNHIPELLSPGPDGIDAHVRVVLTNAVYFNGAWKEPFKKAATHDAPSILDLVTK